MRELLIGELDWKKIPSVIDVCNRVQINTHGESVQWSESLADKIDELGGTTEIEEVIFQGDGINDRLAYFAQGAGINASILHDLSSGTGVTPNNWPVPDPVIPCGYAGGLGPDNVLSEIKRMEIVAGGSRFWIDMEQRVQTNGKLDLGKVRRVLEFCAPLIVE